MFAVEPLGIFFAPTRAARSAARTEFRSSYFKNTPPIFTFCEIVRNSLGAKRLGMVFPRNFEGIFEIARQRAVGNAEVPVRSSGKMKFCKPIFFLSPKAKG